MLNQIFEWKKVRVFLEYAVYLVLTMLLQALLFSRLSFFGAKGFIIPAAAVAAGIYLGGVKGAVFGLFLGLFTDMNFSETTVLFTILFSLIGFMSGFLSEFYINKSFPAFMILSTAAILFTGLVQLVLAIITSGAELFPGLLTVALQTLLSILPVMLLYLPFRDK